MTYEDFYPGFAKTKAFYDVEFPPGSKKPWPWDKPPRARDLEDVYRDVIDPATREYYLDENGKKPEKKIYSIVRFRTIDGEEYLYTFGSVRFSDMNRNSVVKPCDKQETYSKPIFKHKTMPDDRGHLQRVTTEIEEIKTMYDVPFTPENVDNLLKLRGSKGCALTVKDELSTKAISCPNIEMFKTKPFDYILNSEWQSAEDKELALREHEALTQGTGNKKKG